MTHLADVAPFLKKKYWAIYLLLACHLKRNSLWQCHVIYYLNQIGYETAAVCIWIKLLKVMKRFLMNFAVNVDYSGCCLHPRAAQGGRWYLESTSVAGSLYVSRYRRIKYRQGCLAKHAQILIFMQIIMKKLKKTHLSHNIRTLNVDTCSFWIGRSKWSILVHKHLLFFYSRHHAAWLCPWLFQYFLLYHILSCHLQLGRYQGFAHPETLARQVVRKNF